jgi:hypothetical protein
METDENLRANLRASFLPTYLCTICYYLSCLLVAHVDGNEEENALSSVLVS